MLYIAIAVVVGLLLISIVATILNGLFKLAIIVVIVILLGGGAYLAKAGHWLKKQEPVARSLANDVKTTIDQTGRPPRSK